MTNSQPVTISYFKLPINERLLFRIKAIFEIFQSKLEYLTLARPWCIQDPNDPNTLDPEVKKLLIPLRQLASDQVENMAMLMRLIREYSTSFIELVNASPLPDAGEAIPEALVSVIDCARRAVGHWTLAKGEMVRFSREVMPTAQKISTVLDNNRSGANFLTEENSRAVNDLIHAAEECSTIIEKVYQYLRDTLDHFQNETLSEHPPSTEEIVMIQRRWTEFFESMGSLDYDSYRPITVIKIRSGPSLVVARIAGKFLRDTDARESTSTSAGPNSPTEQRKAIVDANTPDEESAPPSVPVEPKPSFFRALLWWILSCVCLSCSLL